MNSKLFKYLFLNAIIIISFGCTSNEIQKDKRPNIVFFLVDDQRNDVLSIEGHPIVKTPTIDKLATSGVRFNNAFVTTSICAASRASIFMGQYETKHGYTFGKDPLKNNQLLQTYPYLLKESGYDTGFIGKFGIKIEDETESLAKMFDFVRRSPKSVPHFEQLEDGSTRHSAEIKGDQAITYIKSQSQNKPFCLSINFNAVHAVDYNLEPGNNGHYPYPKSVNELYENMEMPLPILSDPEIYTAHPDFMKNSMNRERFFWRWDTHEKYQKNIKAYYRMISGYDQVMKRVINSLKENGFDDNTIIIYASDNGYYMGNRGFAGKWSHYEESLRIPLIIYDPRILEIDRGTIVDKMALNIDIPATILDYAGISIPNEYQGTSLNSVINGGQIEEWRNSFFIEHRMENEKIPKFVGIRNNRYVYANYYEQDPPYEYLHDLENDPHQLKNFVDDPKYNELLQEMRIQCKTFEKSIE